MLGRIWQVLIAWWLIGLLGLTGCKALLVGNGEIGFKHDLHLAIYHETEILDEKQTSESELKPMPMTAWIASEDDDDGGG